jgi:hypothetical protein
LPFIVKQAGSEQGLKTKHGRFVRALTTHIIRSRTNERLVNILIQFYDLPQKHLDILMRDIKNKL